MTKDVKNSDQLARMKSLMSYGLQTESKNTNKSVEFTKQGADGKTYAIIREGASYYIKCADKPNEVLAENFDYIGGFMNRSKYRYNSFTDAQKNLDMKMAVVAESCGKRGQVVTESWKPQGETVLMTETTERMREEIRRQRQIMSNANAIMEQKEIEKPAAEFVKNEKQNIKKSSHKTGNAAAKGVSDPFGEKAKTGDAIVTDKKPMEEGKGCCCKCGKNPCQCKNGVCCDECGTVEESDQVLGWNSDKDYMDTKQGTTIGKGNPFDGPEARNIDDDKEPVTSTGEMENGVVESKALHATDNQNDPTPGTNKVGKGDPFNKKKGTVEESIEDFDDDVIDDDDNVDPEDSEFDNTPGDDYESDFETEVGDDGTDDAEFEGDMTSDENEELADDDDVRSMLHQILDRLDRLESEEYEDDDLYDDDDDSDEDADFDGEGDYDSEDDYNPDENDFSDEDDGFDGEGDYDSDDNEPEEDGDEYGPEDDTEECNYFESKDYRRRKSIREANELNIFGKHPAWRKKVMTLPPSDMPDGEGQYDMNDDSVKGEKPYAISVGKGDPFKKSIERRVDNAIQESIKRVLRKKSKKA